MRLSINLPYQVQERLQWLADVNGITLSEAASMAAAAGLSEQPIEVLCNLQVPWSGGPPRSGERRRTELEAQFKAEREARNKARRWERARWEEQERRRGVVPYDGTLYIHPE